jgi:hypothetical protein
LALVMPVLWCAVAALGALEADPSEPAWVGLVAVLPGCVVRAGFWIPILRRCAGLALGMPVLWCAVAALGALEADPAEPAPPPPPPPPRARAGNDVHATNAPINNASFLNEVMFRSWSLKDHRAGAKTFPLPGPNHRLLQEAADSARAARQRRRPTDHQPPRAPIKTKLCAIGFPLDGRPARM